MLLNAAIAIRHVYRGLENLNFGLVEVRFIPASMSGNKRTRTIDVREGKGVESQTEGRKDRAREREGERERETEREGERERGKERLSQNEQGTQGMREENGKGRSWKWAEEKGTRGQKRGKIARIKM